MPKPFIIIRGHLLSKREAEVLLDCAFGLKIDQTADKLCISFRTVQKHRENLRLKFGLLNGGSHALMLFGLEVKKELEEFLGKT